ncbi:MAG: hypothetical protein U0136_00300 [Bdellovibrionota bacterium]
MILSLVRKFFQWAVSLTLLALGLLYLIGAAQNLFHATGSLGEGSLGEAAGLGPTLFREAGVNFSIAAALFGLATVNYWVFSPESSDADDDTVPGDFRSSENSLPSEE